LLGFENILLTLSNTVSSTSYAYFGELIVRINMYINENNGNIRLGAFIKTGGLLLFSWILLLKSNKYNFLTYAFIYLCILLVLFRNTDLVLIRYFFYMHLYICVFYSYCLETPI
jgi:integral membrane sensor domain MASE1